MPAGPVVLNNTPLVALSAVGRLDQPGLKDSEIRDRCKSVWHQLNGPQLLAAVDPW